MDEAEEIVDPSPWRRALQGDLDAIMAIQDRVHSMLPEGRAAFANKLDLFGDGCLVLAEDGHVLGYCIAYPWRLGDIPPLDVCFPALPKDADCLFVHDVALLPQARGAGAGRACVRHAGTLARRDGFRSLALVSVYASRPIWTSCGFLASADPTFATKLAVYGPTACYMTAAV